MSKTYPAVEFEQEVKNWGGRENLQNNLDLTWKSESELINLDSEEAFQGMMAKVQNCLQMHALKQNTQDNTDLDGSLMSMKYNLGNSLKKVRIIAKIPLYQSQIFHPQSVATPIIAPRTKTTKAFGSDTKQKKSTIFKEQMSRLKTEPEVGIETPEIGINKPKKFKHSKAQFGGIDTPNQYKSVDFSNKTASDTGNKLSMLEVLNNYARFLQGQLLPEHKKFSEIVAKKRIPCPKCFDFEDQNKKLGCRYCHKKGYQYMDFQTEFTINLVSDMLRK